MKWSLVGALASAFLLGVAPAGQAGGGDSIASAPDVPLGEHQVASRDGVDFWRVSLNAGDLLVVDFGSVDGDWVGACIHRPEVTDYTIADSKCTAARATTGKAQLTYKAGPPGRWTVAFVDASSSEEDYYCLRYRSQNHFDTNSRIAPQYCKRNVSYEVTAYVKTYTATTLYISPAVVEANKPVMFTGSVKGSSVAGGKVELQSYSRGWRTFAVVKIGSNGSFSYKTKIGSRGTYKIRASYAGDATHLPSTAVTTVRVI